MGSGSSLTLYTTRYPRPPDVRVQRGPGLVVLDHILFVPSIFDTKRVLIFFSVTMFVFGVVVIEVWDTQLPIWAFVLALLICTYYITFCCFLSSRV